MTSSFLYRVVSLNRELVDDFHNSPYKCLMILALKDYLTADPHDIIRLKVYLNLKINLKKLNPRYVGYEDTKKATIAIRNFARERKLTNGINE